MFTKQTLWIAIIVSMVIGGFVGVAIDRYGFQNNDSHFGKTRFVNYRFKETRLDQQSAETVGFIDKLRLSEIPGDKEEIQR